jgi:hypothetical protein
MLRDRRISDLCVSETQESTHMSEVRGRNESVRSINNNLKQTNSRGEVVA